MAVVFLAMPGFAIPSDLCSCDPAVQTKSLRQRLESLRSWTHGVSLSFMPHKSFLTSRTETMLRLGGCTYDVTNDMTGLIDILLGAQISVGYPAGMDKYRPEARFGIYIGADLGGGLDLWFSDPLVFDSHNRWVVGQSHDRGDVTAYRIMAAPTLRDSLWDWARAHGYPRQNTAAECQEMLTGD